MDIALKPKGGTKRDKAGQDRFVPGGTGTGTIVSTCPASGRPACPVSQVCPTLASGPRLLTVTIAVPADCPPWVTTRMGMDLLLRLSRHAGYGLRCLDVQPADSKQARLQRAMQATGGKVQAADTLPPARRRATA